jgi:hypothetical protein
MFLSYLMLAVALCLSSIAAFYSIVGLAAIFAAAVVPIVVMGSILEIAKLVVTVWLHEYWSNVKTAMKMYLVPAVGVLMLITSMGIFGFLSKAHLDQAVPAGDISAQVSIFDDKIRTQKDNIDANRKALAQMDQAVDQVMGRSTDEKGADKAVQLRRNQAKERTRLQNEISQAQKEIVKLQEERAPIASQARKVEAEVGPIKYIAALIYGDNPDANLLEKSVRWVIIILVSVFDPLAVMMLLAATESMKWERTGLGRRRDDIAVDDTEQKPILSFLSNIKEKVKTKFEKKQPVYEPDDDPLTEEQIEQIKEQVNIEEPVVEEKLFDEWTDQDLDVLAEETLATVPPIKETVVEPVAEEQQQDRIKAIGDYINYQGKTYSAQAFKDLFPGMSAEADNIAHSVNAGFGIKFPKDATRGDVFIRVDSLPTRMHKFNGNKWIEVDKGLSDTYVYNDAYIDHLIESVAKGEYDPELLTESEKELISRKLKTDDTNN